MTKYYYYLRKWTLEYRREIDPQDLDVVWFFSLLDDVDCVNEEEKNALFFWKRLFIDCQDLVTSKLLNSADLFLCTSPFTGEIDETVEIIKGKKLNFSVFDLYSEQEISKQYDMVVASNILEYAPSIDSLAVCRDNLYRCLKDDGIVICSNVRYLWTPTQETDIFNDKFKYDNGIESVNPFNSELKVVHYHTYKKVKNSK